MVTDAHRLLGPLPFDGVPSATVGGLLAELDRLAIRDAYVTHTRSLFADPVGGNEALFRETHDRLRPVPVVIPGWVPSTVDTLVGWRTDGVRMVRLSAAVWLRNRYRMGLPPARRFVQLAAAVDAAPDAVRDGAGDTAGVGNRPAIRPATGCPSGRPAVRAAW